MDVIVQKVCNLWDRKQPKLSRIFRRMNVNWKILICGGYLCIQIVLIISARFSSNRYFVWAPHDIQIEYFLEVYVEGQKMDDSQLRRRYNLKDHGWVDLPASHVIEWLTEYERLVPYSKTDSISFEYSVNGGEWTKWTWNTDYRLGQ